MYITLVVSLINIFLNLLLIHLYGGIGSAISFLICTLIQVLLYYKLINQTQIQLNLKSCLITFSIAIFSVIISKQLTSSFIILAILSISIYLFLLLFTKQINILRLKQLIKN
jgi:O-antigen/teichoic acid export membrane protein